jgi:hypothetical protein
VIVENLRQYLYSDEIRTASNSGIDLSPSACEVPLLLGRRFAPMGNMNETFTAGGAGYVINKATLKIIMMYSIPPPIPSWQIISADDIMLSRVLRPFGVVPYPTQTNIGEERFMPFDPKTHYHHRKKPNSTYWYDKYSINIKEGLDNFAKYSISFHFTSPTEMKIFYTLLYGLCSIEESP